KKVELTEAAVQKKTELTERKDLLVEAAYNYRDETTESLVKRKEALQKRADEIMESMMRGGFGAKRLLKAFPRMVPSSYKDAWAALREKAHLGGRHSQDSDLAE
ncbi:MAG: hypothetical protein Q4B26_09795, partial [Eubacteriales bacterium]|nr:hypothetical protein [Eubacteriales bacterium]